MQPDFECPFQIGEIYKFVKPWAYGLERNTIITILSVSSESVTIKTPCYKISFLTDNKIFDIFYHKNVVFFKDVGNLLQKIDTADEENSRQTVESVV